MRRSVQLIAILLCLAANVRAANWPEHPILHAVRATSPITIDGVLDEAAWQSAPEFTEFTQHDPDDGQPPTMKTSLKIVYDDKAIYFGARMWDPQPPNPRLVRRDTFSDIDFLSINLDPMLDRRSGNAFTLTPSNVQLDSVLFNDIGEDGSWDGVWSSATKILPDGWVAEVRIPYSQLRFADKPVQVWGINVTRRTMRNNEWVRIVNTRKGETGFVSHFADIVGIEGIHRGTPLEVVPYAVARSDVRTRLSPGDPLTPRQDGTGDAGLDLKYGLTNRLTLTGTINPDFGQVEVDPAVVNLTQFETFYPEKRPFFTEGVDVFQFSDAPSPSHFNFLYPPQLFYTRRIGRTPQLVPDADYLDEPSNTRILGAAKLTGTIRDGWSVGVLDALTSAESARFVRGGIGGRQQVEPMSNYFVGRSAMQLGENSRIGVMLTDVDRRLDSDTAPYLRRSALTGGIDGYTRFLDKSWVLEGDVNGTRVDGSADAIAATQEAPAHNYQRPDAQGITFDPTRTSLSGWGGRAMLSKTTGIFRPNIQVRAYSPGFEVNDSGYMQRADMISTHAVMQVVDQNPTAHTRERDGWIGVWTNRNFEGDTLERGILSNVSITYANYWQTKASLLLVGSALDDRLTRGGPLARYPGGYSFDASVISDTRKKFSVEIDGHSERYGDGSYSRNADVLLTMRPAPTLQLSAGPTYSRSYGYTQYVATYTDPTATATYGARYVFAQIDQHSFDLTTRADWTLTPHLSFQIYLQPFIASGHYHDYHALAAARTRDYTPYAYTGTNPDFNFRSLRGNAVVRWEFRPGSTLYVAWNENRADVVPLGDFSLHRDLRAIPGAPSHDVFLVKVSYWLPM